MRTTILAYVIAILGIIIIIAGALGPLYFANRQHGAGSFEVFRNGNWNDIWWLFNAGLCSGFAFVGDNISRTPRHLLTYP
jgi:hypothetical protein